MILYDKDWINSIRKVIYHSQYHVNIDTLYGDFIWGNIRIVLDIHLYIRRVFRMKIVLGPKASKTTLFAFTGISSTQLQAPTRVRFHHEKRNNKTTPMHFYSLLMTLQGHGNDKGNPILPKKVYN